MFSWALRATLAASLLVVALLPGSVPAQPPSAFCHVTDGAITMCPDGSTEWSDVPGQFFPETGAWVYADQADLDPDRGIPGSPLDTFVLFYDECHHRTPMGPDEYLLVTFDTVDVHYGREVLERYSVRIFTDGTLIFLEDGEIVPDDEGRVRARVIEGQRAKASFGPTPACPWDHLYGEYEVALTATGIYLNGGYSPDPLFWSADPPNRPPVAADDAERVEDSEPVTVNVLANDSDSDGTIDPSTVQIGAQPEKGSVSVVGGGSVTYTPGPDFEDSDSFTYTVADDDGATSNQAQVEITSCPPGRAYPVVLPQVNATLSLLKPWRVSYDALPLTFTTQEPPSPAYCSARSNTGVLNVRVTCTFLIPPLGPCPFPPGIPVRVATSTATATLDFFRAEDAPAVPVCDWAVVRTGCLLNAGGGGTYVRWTTPGFQITDAFLGLVSYNTGPHTFWANLSPLAPASASLGAKIQAVETFFHTTLISRLSSIDRVAIVQDPPANSVVTDPAGRRTGKLADGTVLQEIPGSAYFETDEATAVIVVQPAEGFWTGEAIGEPLSPYSLGLAVVDFFGADPENPAVSELRVEDVLPPSGASGPFPFEVRPRAGLPPNVISNGTVILGVNREGHLNVPGGPPSPASGTTYVGLRYLPTGNEATAPGCLCEGWGVADAASGVTGHANEAFGPPVNMTVESYFETSNRAVSVVRVGSAFRVTHDYHPSASPSLVEGTVTIENTSAAPADVRYRRVMDWDVEPTPFAELVTVVTVQGSERAENVLYSSDDGFATADPLGPRTFIRFEGDAVDSGPDDHGALFDFGFGLVPPGESVTFNVYYGAAGTEADANAALQAVRAEVYSYGQPSTPDGPTLGTPNTFVFAFSKVGGAPAVPTDADEDGLRDDLDNCPHDPNQGQEDANLNGLGDACEAPVRKHSTAGFLHALLDGTTLAEPWPVGVTQEPSLVERSIRIVDFRLAAGLATDAEQVARNLGRSLVESGLLPADELDAFVADVLAGLDAEPPVTTATVTPEPNALGWNAGDVVVELAATDEGSGVGSISYRAAGATAIPPTVVDGASASIPLTDEGETTLTYFAADRSGNVEAERTLVVRIDRTAPVLSCAPSPGALWPPNHQLVPVTVAVAVSDPLSGPSGFVLVSAESSELDDAPGGGDGHTTGDVDGWDVGTPDTSGLLRAERAGPGPGRVYTLRYSAEDRAGNDAGCSAAVTVAHDQGGGS